MSKASSTEQKAAARLAEQLDRLPADIRRVLMESFADAAEAIAERYDPGREQNKPLTDAERKALESVGVSVDRSGTFYRPIVRTAILEGTLLATALSPAQAARVLGISGRRLRQHLSERTLIGVKRANAWLIPSFQFAGEGELPGLAIVLKAIRETALPIEIAGFFESEQPDLVDESEEPMTPRQWLIEGRDPQAVASLARGI